MIARLANVYIRFLLLAQLVFLGLSLSVLAGTLLSTNPIFAEHGKYLLDCVFVAFVPAVSVAEEKNIWKNEFRRCPKWLRTASLTLMGYGVLVACAQAVLLKQRPLEDQPLFASGVSLVLESMSFCILYSLLWAAPSGGSDLVKRVRFSIITLTICLAFIVAAQLGYLPNPLGS